MRTRLLFLSAMSNVEPATVMPLGPLKRATGSDPSANPVAGPTRRVTTTGAAPTSAMTRMPVASAMYAAAPKNAMSQGLLKVAAVPRPSAVPAALPAMLTAKPDALTTRMR